MLFNLTIGIANTMNLKDQLLPKIQSRMGERTLVYKPYTNSQIEQILLNRLQKVDIILPEALTFLGKKIATFSSDIRRTLHVCRYS
jgi:origin recognition complex subunit 1